MMKKLLSLPPNLVEYFHEIEKVSREEYFCTSDPIGSKLGSGGGTTWLLEACHQAWGKGQSFDGWLASEKRILLHAGGQSRRLPGYAPSGKILTPIPVFRWARGQRINQNLLSLQLPLYERIMKAAPDSLHTLIASGDVYIRAGKLQPIPEADVVCYGLWVDPSLAKNHGVFVSSRQMPDRLDFMLQKPSVQQLGELMHTHLFLMDIGIWLLSDRAVKLLMKRSFGEISESFESSKISESFESSEISDSSESSMNSESSQNRARLNYCLYSQFGCALGEHPTLDDPELSQLSVAILPLQDGEFYHYGTSREMISSTMTIQNLVYDQRSIMHYGVKPHPSIFIQNAISKPVLTAENVNTWIENSYIGPKWKLTAHNIVTGVPENDWQVTLHNGVCVDVVPMGEKEYVLRPYGFNDAFRGPLLGPEVLYLGRPAYVWFFERGLRMDCVTGGDDLQSAGLFPVTDNVEDMGKMLRWMVEDPKFEEGRDLWLKARKMSADEISSYANLRRFERQRRVFLRQNLVALAQNHRQSIFYQCNLDDLAEEFAISGLPIPQELPDDEPLLRRINGQMFRSQLLRYRGEDGEPNEHRAFELLREGLAYNVLNDRQLPHMDVYADQIVWGRSPVRIDIAGGWTDTPPHCLFAGGNVVNLAIELNGQPPLQTYVKPSKDFQITLRSIDLGAVEVVRTYEELNDFARVGSPFSIPKAALCLAGFLPRFSLSAKDTLEEQLRDFGCGIEVTLLSAVPAGSGLGTSSILASTVLGAVANFCGLAWDAAEICNRTLVLEQLLTTGGGWQDQFGGVLHGVKLLRTNPGFDQTPEVRWLPDTLYTDPQFAPCHLLYYTGITRTAKQILAEIVRGMFLNDTKRLQLLSEMKEHALDLYEAILRGDFDAMGRLVGKSWQQNKLLDYGTNPAAVQQIISQIEDYCLGLKLPGAGGGGFLYMVAKDPEAAARIRQTLTSNRPNSCARFVEMSLSQTGLQVSRS